jgi:hypothetical protein
MGVTMSFKHIMLKFQWSLTLQPFAGPRSLIRFVVPYAVGTMAWTGFQSVATSLPTHEYHRLRVGFQPTATVGNVFGFKGLNVIEYSPTINLADTENSCVLENISVTVSYGKNHKQPFVTTFECVSLLSKQTMNIPL